MNGIWTLLIFKLLGFIGATLNTIGFLTFLTFASIESYRWHMIIGGIILIIFSELTGRYIIKRATNSDKNNE